PVFASKSLPRGEPLSINKTDTHVVLRAGPWTLFSEIKTNARFPDIERALPAPGTARTRLRLGAEDAEFLAQAIDRLPGADELSAPVTVDLNGRVAIRAKSPDQADATELLLSRSRYTGSPVCFITNREFLGRAVRLGFRELAIGDAEAPIVCRDGKRTYGWQPLSKESAIESNDDAIRVTSSSSTLPQAIHRERPSKARTPLSERIKPPKSDASIDGAANGHATTENNGAVGFTALIQEAETLHEQLSDAKSRTARLIAALRRQRKRERLVARTLASLKELKLPDVAEEAHARSLVPPSRDRPSVIEEKDIMPLKLNVGVSRKLGLPDYCSAGASCNIEVELDSGLLQHDLGAFHAEVRAAFLAARQAVDDELIRLQSQPAPAGMPATVSGHGRRNGAPPRTNGASARAGRTHGQPPKRATPNQVKAIRAIARRQNADLGGLLVDEFGVEVPEDLTLPQASAVIDQLKSASES